MGTTFETGTAPTAIAGTEPAAPDFPLQHERSPQVADRPGIPATCARSMFHATQTGLIIIDTADCRILDVNRAAAEILDQPEEDLVGQEVTRCGVACLCDRLREGSGTIARHQSEVLRRDGSVAPVILSATALDLADRQAAVLSFMDISDLTAAQKELRQTNRQLESALRQLHEQRDAMVQSEKLASIGQLAAGVAHEINNPIGYVTSNLATISEYIETMRSLIELYRERDGLAPDDPRRTELTERIRQVAEEEDLGFVLADIEDVLRESVEGTTRVTEIVQNLKSFARDDSLQKRPYDLNDCVESMVRLVWNELKYSCRVEKDLGAIPPMIGHGGRINQVVMNILVNAAHAIGAEQGVITIRTRADAEEATLEITDTGCGMTAETVARIFEPFYTTKDVGRGTGLGLAISHGIVTEHGGRIEVRSAPGAGSTFRVILPLPAHEEDILIA